ncbi:MAG: hypothetical protein IPF93_13190 [Saprospiraceae bacterium]|nr:hypothetical protein [Saprospiraceae bacterium]
MERTYTLLHEIGHILNDHVSFQDQSIDRELELNTFVGNMFFQIGIPKQFAIESVSLRRLRTKTHPSGKEIREKLLEGYEQAERMDKLDIFTYLQSLNPEKYERT